MTAIVWFRRDLRLAANPAFSAAVASGKQVVAVFVLDKASPSYPGAASRVWLHNSLCKLRESLLNIGIDLVVRNGKPVEELSQLAKALNASGIYWNREYEPDRILESNVVKSRLGEQLNCHSFNGRLLVEPFQLKNKAGKPFRVFTPFWKHLRVLVPEDELPKLKTGWRQDRMDLPPTDIEDLDLLTGHPWESKLKAHWQFGEQAAHEMLDEFIEAQIVSYPDKRDLPAIAGTSKLSPYFHFGEISVHQAWQAVTQRIGSNFYRGQDNAAESWLRQLGWREFAYHLLFHFPHTTEQPLNEKFAAMQWQENEAHELLWQQGNTGYPLVDAGMRELWETGWMHNRVRMVVASFLTKHLGLHWRKGAAWFWDTLFDADLANNSLGWQWVAGSGADAAPYYRIFNPTRQSERFDAKGDYIRRWVPELRELETSAIHQPESVLSKPGNVISYPKPCVEHRDAREKALARYQEIRA